MTYLYTAATKKSGVNYLPAIIIQNGNKASGKTIKEVRISTEQPLPTKEAALKYAKIWRNKLEEGK